MPCQDWLRPQLGSFGKNAPFVQNYKLPIAMLKNINLMILLNKLLKS